MEVSSESNHFPILRFPNEVQRIIMEKASEPMSPNNHPNYLALPYYGDLASLVLVCPRFNEIAMKTLCSCICLYADEYRDDGGNNRLSTSTRVVRLHETLRENIQLRRYCTRFTLVNSRNSQQGGPVESLSLPIDQTWDPAPPHQLSTPWAKAFASIVLDCTKWLFNTRILVISGHAHGTFLPELGDITYRVLSCAKTSMPRLERIEILKDISYHCDVLTLYDIQLGLSGGCSSLKHLIIRRRVRNPSRLHRSNALFPRSLHNFNTRSGFSLSSFAPINSSDHPNAVRDFVTWLKGLEHFTLRWEHEFRFEGRKDPQWSLNLVGDILKPHRDSIKSIKLGKMSQPGLGDFDASNFPNLETLTMHHEDLRGIDISNCLQLQAAKLHDVVITTDDIEEEMFYNA
ncbi:hypothetical protein NOF04DRAFT_15891 [Fusarium oxysporum II5]|nr:uncharacterized protein FOIG_14469 [Fusarium odoratissimum NRRL 54006]EXL92519.1 hypothetical protein FOIG_14469 [Fusarium odoratissimum NRRL 54006]KAK2133113.1 hypothetical protein NOF04DRAFT_15891 [Fusarium oxysporum II5]TXC08170.1 hypothetical protein FocTR4_00003295 [Fusarium oxysporum f. sp. cubense]